MRPNPLREGDHPMFDDATLDRPRGRPSRYSDEIAAEICRRISLGESLVSVTNDPAMPSETTVIRWLSDDRYSEFRAMYVRARGQQAEHWADELIDLADSARGQPGHPADQAEVQALRLAVDTRKWVLSKLLPRRYGDRIDVQQDGQLVVRIIHGLGERRDEPS